MILAGYEEKVMFFFMLACAVVYLVYRAITWKPPLQKQVVAKTTGRHLVGYKGTPVQTLEVGLKTIQQADPSFDFAAFAKRCARSFKAIHIASSEDDLAPVRHLMSDGLYERFVSKAKIDDQFSDRFMEHDIKPTNVEAVLIERSDPFDIIQVRIEARSFHFRKAELGQKGNYHASPYAEYWSFIRMRGAQTGESGFLAEKTCPCCATPLAITDRGHCTSCDSLVIGGTHDWIVVEITQATAGNEAIREIPGLDTMRQKDPSFHPQIVEDRMSAIFWRERIAEHFRDSSHLAAVSSPACQRHRSWIYFARPSVGAVEVTSIIPSADAHDFDRVHVTVKWAGIPLQSLQLMPDTPRVKINYASHYVLIRQQNTKTVAKMGLLSLHCENCGHTFSDTEDAACSACGTQLNDGKHGWVLEQRTEEIAAA